MIATALLVLMADVSESSGTLARFNVRMADTVVLPSLEAQPQQVTARHNETMWSADLGVEAAATLSGPVSIAAGGLSADFTPKTALWRATPEKSAVVTGKLYCGLRFRNGTQDLSELPELIFRTPGWDGSSPRLCLLDQDSDGQFDHAVAAGRVKSGPIITPITPTGYAEQADRRVKGATLQVRASRNPLARATQIGLEGYLNDRPIGSGGLNLIPPGADRLKGIRPGVMVPKSAFPAPVQLGGMEFSVLGFDPATNAVTIRMDKGFYRSPVLFDRRLEFVFY